MSTSSEPILTFENISLSDAPPDGRGFSLDLNPGELALFPCERDTPIPKLANLSTGVVEPPSGQVKFRGCNWAEMSPREKEEHRKSIGRVFAPRLETAWLQNLDVDENILLTQLFKQETTPSGLQVRADALAARLGLGGLPHTRPSATNQSDLTRSQWVRALLPAPLHLLVLEIPSFGLAREEDLELLSAEVSKARENGTAVLWLETNPRGIDFPGLKPTTHFERLPKALADD